MKLLFLFLTVLINGTFISQEESEIKDAVIGKWKWVETSGGFAGKIHTPESMGNILLFIYEKDGTYVIIKNDKPENKGTYTIYKEKSRIFNKDEFKIKHTTNSKILRFQNNKNTLLLIDDFYDGLIQKFERLKN